MLAISAGVACCLHSVRADSHAFSPAYGEQGNLNLRLFTFDGKETTVPLPAPAKVFRDLWFSAAVGPSMAKPCKSCAASLPASRRLSSSRPLKASSADRLA